MDFKVSVIIPVYNAKAFLRDAVESVVCNEYVGEINLVEDRSPDGCLQICKELEKKYEKIRLYQHPNGENRGAGESRNLGIRNATCDYIAFLDADDYYLPERFDECKCIFMEDSTIDFVFGISQYEKEYESRSGKIKRMEIKSIDHFDVFDSMLTAKSGYFDTNSITIKKESLDTLDQWFNPLLKLHQDSEFWLRIAYYLKGKPDLKVIPGAIVRQHEHNRIKHKNSDSLFLYWSAIKKKFQNEKLTRKQQKIIDFYYFFYQQTKGKPGLSFSDKLLLKYKSRLFKIF